MKKMILGLTFAVLTGFLSLLPAVYNYNHLANTTLNRRQCGAAIGLGASTASLYMALQTVHNINTLNRLFPKPIARSTQAAFLAAGLSAVGVGYFGYHILSEKQKRRIHAALTLSDKQKNYLKTTVAHAKNAVISAANKPVAPYAAWIMPNL